MYIGSNDAFAAWLQISRIFSVHHALPITAAERFSALLVNARLRKENNNLDLVATFIVKK